MSKLGDIKGQLLYSMSPVWKFYCSVLGLKIGTGFKCIGRPSISRKRGSLITLGSGVTMHGGLLGNPISSPEPCRLSTISRNATLEIQDRVGLSSAVICAAKKISVGEGSMIGAGALIIDTDFHPRVSSGSLETDPAAVSKEIQIGKNCFIGTRTIILKGVKIGDNVTIGAGSVVTRSIPNGAIVGGCPAKIIGSNH